MKKAQKRRFLLLALILLAIIAAVIYFLPRLNLSSSEKIKVYFLKDEKLAAVERPPLKNVSPLIIVAQSLGKGPTAEERKLGYYTEIPKGAHINKVDRQGKLATVDFNLALESYGGGATRVEGMIGQIVYSFTGLPGINEVKITVNGKDEVILGGEGYVIDKPLSRADIAP
ncbi:hypothetical protein A2276_00570 [candidate division WOR-1 bacterium RIFOXYA12_FULL_43_27]|uniref:GerMN domain-containing protein n=1 Tax=candidate division WOR-1 bacterium RIFOXYC2_FULL_46_14 TaxID=1802587 RepID=A0A1F4U6D8_UNCSA|nr:MAG: hypothetical protein A2276_00570 [candidate division WOR-1 bacterium RIFOXYA12_FULL_43_27]OGC20815.1 MAG: hypothetical protein A2292_07305 [candidate division WOR-1 bacterium RIFOXYB2_FULL_46_45]OGC31448.1 MAG: hypothetical protein A2232_04145 [candidate division WOR-1 bacterium RIFOXYA2_FULL_46_56]OGC39853.1 MAG: hypothetical protein A2438_04980 [candidate division WOR-1 bacterium RIFOXYC2_FULL_46_14]